MKKKIEQLTVEQKANLISAIISTLSYTAKEQKKAFCSGDIFFSLAFKSDSELLKIAKLCGI